MVDQMTQINMPVEDQQALELVALKRLETLKRQAMPRNAKAWHDMPFPLAREHIEDETCRMIGKVFSWSPLYFDVAILVGETVVRR